jgi:hypothetical protein
MGLLILYLKETGTGQQLIMVVIQFLYKNVHRQLQCADVIATDLMLANKVRPYLFRLPAATIRPNVDACGTSIQQFINYTIVPILLIFLHLFDSLTGYRNGTTTTVYSFSKQADSSNYNYTSFNFTGAATPARTTSVRAHLSSLRYSVTFEYTMEGPITISITEYGALPSLLPARLPAISGNDIRNVVVSGTCNFRVRRF